MEKDKRETRWIKKKENGKGKDKQIRSVKMIIRMIMMITEEEEDQRSSK